MEESAFTAFRLLCAAAILGSLMLAWRRAGSWVLVSPPALLALQTLVLYSLLPWLLLGLHRTYMSRTHDTVATYMGSSAEALVLIFAVLLGLVIPAATGRHAGTPGLLSRRGVLVVGSLGGAAILAFIAMRVLADGPWGAGLRQIKDGLLPISLVAGGVLHLHWLGNPRIHARFTAVALILAGALLMGGTGKPVFHAVGAAVLSWLVLSPVAPRRRLTAMLAMTVMGVVAVTTFAVIRDPLGPERLMESPRELGRGFTEKVVDRQLETGWCFQNALRESWRVGDLDRAFYFLAGPVPRILWPHKPDLSVGHDLGVRYCGMPTQVNHSASVTLLGEPIIQAGILGLGSAVAACVAGLIVLTRMGIRMGLAGFGLWIGLAPWIVDFDQTFAMYVGNGIKSILYAAPVWLAALWWRQDRQPGARSCAE